MNIKRSIWTVLLSICMITACFTLTVDASATSSGNSLSRKTMSGGNAPRSIEITEININVEIPKVGAENNKISFRLPDEVNYTVSSAAKWLDLNHDVADSFTYGNDHIAKFSVTPKSGYILSKSAVVKVNGSGDNVKCFGGSENPASEFEFVCRPELLGLINQIHLTDVPEAVIGEVAAAYTYSEPNGQYEIKGSWYRYDAASGQYHEMSAGTDSFESGNVYEFRLFIDPADGYLLDLNCWMSVNDIEYDIINNRFSGEVNIPISFAEEVEIVTIKEDDIPEAVIGEKFEDISISIPVKEKKYVKASGYWTYTDETGTVHRTGIFEKGKEYYFHLEIVSNEGYSLSENLRIQVGDEELWPDDNRLTKASTSIRTSFATVIQKAELLNLPTASVGDSLKEGIFSVAVPKKSAYTAEAWWTYYDAETDSWNVIDDACTVQRGMHYRLNVQLTPAKEHEFADKVQVKAYGVWHQPFNVTPTWVLFEKDFSFQKQISNVEVTGMKNPKIGAVPSVKELKVPSDAHYTIADAQWRDVDDGSFVDVFETDHAYLLEIHLKANKGYEFKSNVSAFLNGEETEIGSDRSNLYITKQFSFKDVLKEIRIDNVPEMKVGEKATADIKIPKGAKYFVDVFWRVWNTEKKEYEPFEGVFKAGKVYELMIIVIPDAGYEFDEDITTFLINGKEDENTRILGNNVDYRKEFSTKLTEINRIELEILEPEKGHHSSIRPVITLPAGANYELSDDTRWIQGELDKNWPFDGYFEEADNYGASILLFAKEGYVFGDNPVMLINGIIPPEDAVWIRKTTTGINFFFDYESLAGNKEEGSSSELTESEENTVLEEPGEILISQAPAKTGDNTSIVWWSFVSIISLAGIFTFAGAKKRAKRY